MIKHFLGCLIRNTSTKSIAILPLPYKNASINGLIHENAYAYFSFESDDTSFPPKPSNISSITYLGGQVYTQEEMALEIIKKGLSPCIALIDPFGRTNQDNIHSTLLIHTSDNSWMPFLEGDTLINVLKET